MSLSPLASVLVIPPLNLLAAACAGALLRRRRIGPPLLAIGLGGMVLLAMPIVSGTLLTSLESNLPVTPSATDPPQAIVVLSADETDILQDGHIRQMAGHLTLEREAAGAALARRTKLPILVTGGSAYPGDTPLATMMASSLAQDFGTPATWTETASQDTWQNARFSAAILHAAGIRSVYLVTHAWHERRALIAFRAAGLAATAAPVPLDAPPRLALHNLLPHVAGWQESFYALHEWLGTAWYALRA